MTYTLIDKIPVWGIADDASLRQIKVCRNNPNVFGVALLADNHQGYGCPIGGIVAYIDHISPTVTGYDISCGNKAVKLNLRSADVLPHINELMDEIFDTVSFGIGRKNNETVEHELFHDDSAWQIGFIHSLKQVAQNQLGTVGSGNHFVNLMVDEDDNIWVAVHFGSRGFGHKIATHYIQAGGGKDGIDVAPVVFNVNSNLGQEYIAAMQLAGRYAYAGRDWVCQKVANILGAEVVESVHNHHNFAWKMNVLGQDVWVGRKGATPAAPGQRGFIGGTMGDISVIVEGVESDDGPRSFYSTVHGAGRVMSRTAAAGKKRWDKERNTWKRISEGAISREAMLSRLEKFHVVLRGAGEDEAPQCYKNIEEVLESHKDSIKIVHTMRPIGVAMAGDTWDPYKD